MTCRPQAIRPGKGHLNVSCTGRVSCDPTRTERHPALRGDTCRPLGSVPSPYTRTPFPSRTSSRTCRAVSRTSSVAVLVLRSMDRVFASALLRGRRSRSSFRVPLIKKCPCHSCTLLVSLPILDVDFCPSLRSDDPLPYLFWGAWCKTRGSHKAILIWAPPCNLLPGTIS